MREKPRLDYSAPPGFPGSGVMRAARPVLESTYQPPSLGPSVDGSSSNVGSLEQKLLQVMGSYVGEIMARAVLIHCAKACDVQIGAFRPGDAERFALQLEKGLRIYVQEPLRRSICVSQMKEIISGRAALGVESHRQEVLVTTELDIVTARNVGRDMCKTLGFNVSGQTRVATAISELARNIVQYTPGGVIELSTLESPRRGICIVARDTGKGIPNLDEILEGRYVSRTGMGKGLAGTRQLMDSFGVRTGASGTEITTRKYVSGPAQAPANKLK